MPHQSLLVRKGALFVFLSATTWSFGGAIARYLSTTDSFAVIFWRSLFAAMFLAAYMIWRDGPEKSWALIKAMGWPGLGVASCFVVASMSFVTALNYTTVANVLLMQAGTPLLAALGSWILFREKVSGPTWLAIFTVMFGVCVMVKDSLTGQVSPIGDGLALLIAIAFACSTVIARRHSHIDMQPAVLVGCIIATLIASTQAKSFTMISSDYLLLFAFGVINLGLGLAFYAAGVRLVPSAVAALIGTAEPVLGPIWVWLAHDEVPSRSTIVGGSIVFIALLLHVMWQLYQSQTTETKNSNAV